MNLSVRRALVVSILAALLAGGCGRQTRGNADMEKNRAATPAEGGATSTAGGAGDPRNFGDTRATQQQEGTSQSASPTGWSKDAKTGETSGTTPPATGTNTPPASNPK